MPVVEFWGAEASVPAFAGKTARSLTLLLRLSGLVLIILLTADTARADDLGPILAGLGGDSFAAKEKAVVALAKSGDPRAVAILQSLSSDRLRKAPDGRIVILEGPGATTK